MKAKDVAGAKEMIKDMEGWEIREYRENLLELGITSKYILGLNALNIYTCMITHICAHSSRDARFWKGKRKGKGKGKRKRRNGKRRRRNGKRRRRNGKR